MRGRQFCAFVTFSHPYIRFHHFPFLPLPAHPHRRGRPVFNCAPCGCLCILCSYFLKSEVQPVNDEQFHGHGLVQTKEACSLIQTLDLLRVYSRLF